MFSSEEDYGEAVVHRYSAKMLFQFRVEVNSVSAKFRTVEERVCVTRASDSYIAHSFFNELGLKDEFSYVNDEGNRVFFEFIGIMEMIRLGIESEENEVWYDIRTRKLPMENRHKLVPKASELQAMKEDEQKRLRARYRGRP